MRLADNTLIVVEQNLDLIKTADWVIDLGPESGEAGGQIIAEGRPEQVAKVAGSHTGRFLTQVLARQALRVTNHPPASRLRHKRLSFI